MDWLSKLDEETFYRFKNMRTGKVFHFLKKELKDDHNIEIAGGPGDRFVLDSDEFIYSGFEPRNLNIMTKITFEKNGRKALRVKNADGSQSVRSMSKENYLKGRGTKSVLTKGCEEASTKVKKEIVRKKYNQWTKGV